MALTALLTSRPHNARPTVSNGNQRCTADEAIKRLRNAHGSKANTGATRNGLRYAHTSLTPSWLAIGTRIVSKATASPKNT